MVILRWIFVLALVALTLAGIALTDAADRVRRPLGRRGEREPASLEQTRSERLRVAETGLPPSY